MITNALIRIDGVKGSPPAPFEKPNDQFDFWVLEIGLPLRVKSEKAQAVILKKTLNRAKKILVAKIPKSADITLFLEFDSQQLSSYKLDHSMVSTLAAFGGNLEIAIAIV